MFSVHARASTFANIGLQPNPNDGLLRWCAKWESCRPRPSATSQNQDSTATVAGKRRDMGLGPVHAASLAEAREEARRRRQMLRGRDRPHRGPQGSQAAEMVKAMSFRDSADAYIRAQEASWQNAKHAAQ